MKKFNKPFTILFFCILFFTSCISYAQSEEPVSEKLRSDALAMAQISCDQNLTMLSLHRDLENIDLQRKVGDLTLLMTQMNVTMINRYSDEAQKKKFDREIKSAKKQLGKCIKYQNILDAKAKEEKEKAEQTK